MKINNFEHLRAYFHRLNNPNHFYFVQVLRRKKDDGQPPNFHVIRNYYLFTPEEFDKAMPGIIELCESNNARAYFWINPRDSERIALETAKALITLTTDKTTKNGYKVYDHVCGKNRCNQYEPLWIIDIDDESQTDEVMKFIGGRFFDKIKTRHGCHIISTKFNTQEFHDTMKFKIDIHKDNPTLLYYAEDGREDM